MRRIVVTGWRDWPESHRHYIWRSLDLATALWVSDRTLEPIVVAQGECPYGGVDRWVKQWTLERGHVDEPWPAAVGPGGRILGPARNARMIKPGASFGLAFPGPGSRGTWDCLAKLVDAGIPVHVYAWSNRAVWL